MRKNPNETLEEWADRVRQYELGFALQQIAQGQDLNLVMEAMARRIQQKILHPVIIAIKESTDKKIN